MGAESTFPYDTPSHKTLSYPSNHARDPLPVQTILRIPKPSANSIPRPKRADARPSTPQNPHPHLCPPPSPRPRLVSPTPAPLRNFPTVRARCEHAGLWHAHHPRRTLASTLDTAGTAGDNAGGGDHQDALCDSGYATAFLRAVPSGGGDTVVGGVGDGVWAGDLPCGTFWWGIMGIGRRLLGALEQAGWLPVARVSDGV